MAAFGRLWRRAPVWRVCLVSAVAFAGLAAMFPPALPRLPIAGGGAPTGASFHPQPTPPVARNGGGRVIPDGPTHTGILRSAGHDVPLPAGTWQTVAVGREVDADQVQVDVLARIEAGHLTGLLMLGAPTVMSGMVGPVGEPPPCANPGRLALHDLPPRPGDGPLTHACWAVIPEDMKAEATGDAHKSLVTGVLAYLGEQHVRVPDAMLATNLYVSDDRGWRLERVLVPDTGGPIARIRAWADRFLPLVRRGYETGLGPSDIPPALARDPGTA